MSGHSKWATIKRKKAATDSKRGKIFTKYLKEIQMAAKLGGANIEGNARLKTAVVAAKAESVPNDNIDRAIKRGAGLIEGAADYEEVIYEGYGPGGIAIIAKCLTDNKNRTVSEVRSTLTKYGGSMASANAVAYMFTEKGIVAVAKEKMPEDQIFTVALEAGAEDIQNAGDVWEVVAALKDLESVKEALEKSAKEIKTELRYVPANTVPIAGDAAKSLLKLLEALDDLDDIQNVYANFEMDDMEMED